MGGSCLSDEKPKARRTVKFAGRSRLALENRSRLHQLGRVGKDETLADVRILYNQHHYLNYMRKFCCYYFTVFIPESILSTFSADTQ